MAFNVFTAIPEPKINISLFGDATTQGIAAGKNLPTTTTAIIQGAQEGIDRGLQTISRIENIETANIQQEVARARLPYEGALAQERLEEAQLSNEVAQIQIEDAQVNRTEKQNLEKSTIGLKETEIQNKTQQLQREEQFLGSFKNASADSQYNMLSSGEFSDVFSKNKNIYSQALDTALLNPNLSGEQKQAIDNLRKRSSAVDYYERLANTRAAKFQEAKEALYASPLTSEVLSNTSDMLPEDVPDKVEFLPAGKYQMSEDGTRLKINPKTGRRMLVEGFNPEDVKDKYIAVMKDNNQVVGSSATQKDFNTYKDYLAARKLQDGTFGRTAADRLTKRQEATPAKAASTQFIPSNATQGPQEAPEVRLMKQSLDLSNNEYKALENPLQNLYKLSAKHVAERLPTTSSFLSQYKDLTQTVDTITNYMIKDEWDKSEAVKSKYTQADVDKWNQEQKKEFIKQLYSDTIYMSDLEFYLDRQKVKGKSTDELFEPFKIDNPQDLYRVQREPVLSKKVNILYQQLVNQQRDQSSAGARAGQQTQNTLKFLETIKNGAHPGQ